MKYLSIDLETTGLDPQKNNIIEFGAICDDTEKPEVPISELPFFHCYVAPPEGGYRGSAVALGMNGAIFKKIGELTKDPGPTKWGGYYDGCLLTIDGLKIAFKRWVEMRFDTKRGITGAGKNFGTFDLQFLKRWLEDDMPRFHHRVLDPAMFFISPTDVEPPNTLTCMQRAGVPGQVEHTALADASVIIQLIRKGLTICGVRL